MDEISLNIPRKIGYLRAATAVAREVASACAGAVPPRRSAEFISDIELVVSEACTNALIHGDEDALPVRDADESGFVVLTFRVEPERITIFVKDRGRGFDITKVAVPDFDAAQAGGYGIYIIRTKMDDVTCYTQNGWNILSMMKAIPGA